MTKRSVTVAVWLALAVLLVPFAVGALTSDPGARGTDALVPPAGELVVFGLAVGLVFALTFLVTYLAAHRRRR